MNPTVKSSFQPAEVQAAYWKGAISRGEAQKVFDEQGQMFGRLSMALTKLDLVLSYICEEVLKVEPKDVEAWAAAKLAKAKEGEPVA